MSLVIVDYGMGNLGSIQNMIKRIGGSAIVTSEAQVIQNADKIILPGVGAFDLAMSNIHRLGLFVVLEEKVIKEKTPMLGICLGMEILAKTSEEGRLPGLGWLDAEVLKFGFDGEATLRVPHMGWNMVQANDDNPLFRNLPEEKRFYFLHSYYLKCLDEEDVAGMTEYGITFCSAVQRKNIFGVQFHPEKSHKFGMQLLKNFLEVA